MNTAAGRPLHTPLPRVNASGLTYNPSDAPWVKLGVDVDAGFKKGQVVQIYGVERNYLSPSQSGDGGEWIPTDADSQYRFRKRCVLVQYNLALLKPVPHRKLHMTPTVPGKPGTHKPRGRYPVGQYDVLYLAEPMRVKWGNKEFEVKKGTAVTIANASSKSGRKEDKVSTNTNVESMYYDVHVYIETILGWTEENCRQGRHVGNFERLTDEEMTKFETQILNKALDTTSRVVPATEVPAHCRDDGATQKKEVPLK